jgi:hypothetical protein
MDVNTDQNTAVWVLQPYTPQPSDRVGRSRRRLIFGLLIAFCLIYGFMFAFFVPFVIMPFLLPPLILAGMVIWSLPDTRTAPTRLLEVLFFAFLIALVLWPGYLALQLPGLPYITMSRLTGGPLALVFVVCLSISPRLRQDLARALRGSPYTWRAFAVFVFIELVSIAFSKNMGFSIEKFVNAQLTWTTVFFLSCYLFARPGVVEKWAATLWAVTIAVCLLGLWESHRGAVPWIDHIPHFLMVQDPGALLSLKGGFRAGLGSGGYRIEGTFTTPLTLGQFLALSVPFVLHFAMGPYKFWLRVAAAFSVCLMVGCALLTQSRSSAGALLFAAMLYVFYWAYRRFRQREDNFIGSLVVWSYPLMGLAVFAASVFIGKIRRKVWGGGEDYNSNFARVTQYQTGVPMVLKHPWGYGIGRGAETLGFSVPGGLLTIDTYYLMIALEYGVVGFVVFYSMFLWTIYKGGRAALLGDSSSRDQTFLAPAVICLTNFVIIGAVFSQQDNNPIVFMALGMVVALLSRVKTAHASAVSGSAATIGHRRILGLRPSAQVLGGGDQRV